MKREINPKIGIVALVIVLAISGYFLWHATTDKPSYPGQNAGHPAAESGPRQSDASSGPKLGEGPITYQQAQKMHIPGMAPGAPMPKAPSRPPGQ